MIQTYKVTGMTCDGCKAKVESVLKTIESVNNVSVHLESSVARVESTEKLSLKLLQSTLPEKYTISAFQTESVLTEFHASEKNKLKQLFPLFLILGYILGASILLNINWQWTRFMLDFMGLFYIVFSFFKFLDINGFATTFKMYDPLAKIAPLYGYVYPFLELVLGIMFLMRLHIPIALLLTLVILGITTIGVVKVLINKKAIQCACLGTVLKLPMTKATFIENSIMIVMALLMLINIYT